MDARLTKYIWILISLLVSLAANADPIEDGKKALSDLVTTQGKGEAFALYIENDSRSVGGPGSDQAYTNGFKFSYIYAQDRIPDWSENTVQRLNFIDKEIGKSQVNFALSLGHQIYTPSDTQTQTLIKDDRPYTGWLYLGFAVSFKEEKAEHLLELDVGTVGQSAFGQQVQNNYHDWVREARAEGWSNVLHDEPTLQMFYQKRLKSLRTNNFDVVPYYGAAFGNVYMGGHFGGLIRFGVNLPDNFGPSRPSGGDGDSFVSSASSSSSKQPSYFVFAGGRANAVVRNLFLDGNTFRTSHHVKKYPFTLESEFGAGLRINPISVVWSFVTRSPEFEERSIFNSFASINFVYFL